MKGKRVVSGGLGQFRFRLQKMRGAGWCTYVHGQWGMIRTEDQASVHNNTWHSRDATALNQSPSLLRNAGFPASVTEEEAFARICTLF